MLVFFAVDTLRNDAGTFVAIAVMISLAVVLDAVWKRARGEPPAERSGIRRVRRRRSSRRPPARSATTNAASGAHQEFVSGAARIRSEPFGPRISPRGIAIVAVLIGVFCTWLASDHLTLSGIEGPNNGWLCVLLAGPAFLWARSMERGSWVGVAGVLASALVIGWTAAENWRDAGRVLDTRVSYGLLLVLAASVVLAAVAVVRAVSLLRDPGRRGRHGRRRRSGADGAGSRPPRARVALRPCGAAGAHDRAR